MRPRSELGDKFSLISGVRKVYYQPPESIKLEYPCIIYKLSKDWAIHANDRRYVGMRRYQVTVIDKEPDSTIPTEVEKIPYCSFDRFFTSDNLNHFVYTIYH